MKQVDFQEFLASIETGLFADFARYWEGLRRGRRFPERSEIDPAAFPKLLPQIYLMDCRDPERITHLLAGDGIRASLQQPVAGKPIDAVHDKETAKILHYLVDMIRARACVLHGVSETIGESGYRWRVERIAFPLADPAACETVGFIIGASLIIDQDAHSLLDRDGRTRSFDLDAGRMYVPEVTAQA